jgi:hypothetical protein
MRRWEALFNPDGTVHELRGLYPVPLGLEPLIGHRIGFVSADDELSALAHAVAEWRKKYETVDNQD